MKPTTLILLLPCICLAAAEPPKLADQGRTIVVHERDVAVINCRVNESTLLILPDGEKAALTLVGDLDHWSATERPLVGRFVSIKPIHNPIGLATDLHIISDHGNSYSFRLVEVSKQPDAVVDAKVFINPDEPSADRIKKPPEFVSAEVADHYKHEADVARQQADALRKESQQTVQSQTDQFRSKYPETMQFDYNWNRGKGQNAPFNVSEVYRDGKFTYIKANPQEAPALYELKDGKPSLIAFTFADGTYTVPKILDAGYLQIGKQKLTFRRNVTN